MSLNNFAVTVTDDFDHIPFTGRIRLLFLLEGNITVQTADGLFSMKPEDFIIINKNRSCCVTQSSGYLLAVIDIDYYMFCRIVEKSVVTFRCNSVLDNGVKYEKFRYIIGQFLNDDVIEPDKISFSKLSSFYRLCNYMVQYFLVSDCSVQTVRADNKIEDILMYLEKNRTRKVSLEEISQYCHMTPTSFSRYFHRETGMTYVSYANQLKLNYAEEALLHGEQTITEIALNAGFSSVSGFNRLFKKVYGAAPREYKNKIRQQRTDKQEKIGRVLEQSLEKYNKRTRLTVVREQKIREVHIVADAEIKEEIINPWKGMVHFGPASSLLSAEYQKQIKILRKELGIQYGCINAIFAKELKIFRNHHQTREYNFSYLDNIMDCLIDNHIYPVISFDDQLETLIKDLNPLKEPGYDSIFINIEECIEVISHLIKHFVYRYGAEEVDNWIFDLWYNEFKGKTLGLGEQYFIIWDQIYDAIRCWLPHAQIGGSGVGPSLGYDRQMKFYNNWKMARNKPDFISINSYPYRQSENRKDVEIIGRKIDHFLNEDLERIEKVLKDSGFPDTPIMILQWNLSFVQRNFFNDTSAKAAIMLSQMVENTKRIEKASYYVASDLYAGDVDTPDILNGASGLLSKDGIRKPAFYALQFIGQNLKYVISKGENWLITCDGRGNMTILLFNSKALNYNYYSKREADITLDIVDNLYLESDSLEISLTIDNIDNGKYYIHKQLIGPEHGDILNEWRQLGVAAPIRMKDIVYLGFKSIPFRKNDCVSVCNHTIKLWERLQEHDIMLMNIEYIPE